MSIHVSKISGLDGRLATKTNKSQSYQPKATFFRKPPVMWARCMNNGSSTAGDQGTTRLNFVVPGASNPVYANGAYDFEAVFANYQTLASGEFVFPNSIQVSASLETSTGTLHRLTFGGKQSVIIDPYAYVKADPVAISMPAGTSFWIRTYVQVQSTPTVAPTVTAQASGGSLAAATYFYKFTTVGPTGESGPSPEASAAVVLNGTATLAIPAQPTTQTISAIKVYRSTTTGTEVYLTTIPAYTTSWIDTGAITAGAASPPAVQKFPLGPYAVNPGTRAGEGTNYPSHNAGAGTDQTNIAGIAWFSGNNNACYGPVFVGATPVSGFSTPVVGIYGDSIAWGTNQAFDQGFIAKALQAANIPYFMNARGSEAVFQVNPTTAPLGIRNRMALADACTAAICEYGTNDLFGSARTLAQIKADSGALWTEIGRRGIPVYQTTILPRTTSSDAWATVGNQATQAAESIRTGFNDWLKDPSASGASAQYPALSGYINTCAVVEVNSANVLTNNGGFWISNGTGNFYTADGIHPGQNGVNVLATTVDTTRFTAI